MDQLAKFTIPFAGLAKGTHQFDYEIDDKFFESFENAVISQADVKVSLDFHKAETVLTLTFRMEGTIRLTCHRCLDEFDLPVNETKILLVRFGEPGVGETDDIIVISHSDHHLNVAQHIYDYLSLLLPMRVVHPDDEHGNSTCDPVILEKLAKEESDSRTGDPRWEVLKNLRNRKN